jgi:FKBP-type peptidyl-prolyl cis-trans isomerase
MTKNFLASVIIGVIVLIIFAYFIFDLNGSSSNSANSVLGTSAISIQPATPTEAMPANSSAKLQIVDEKVGTGNAVKSGDTVEINYVGSLLNGTIFDSTAKHGGQPFTTQIGVGQVIKGWDEGIIGMKVGGKRKLVIPPSLGYGAQTVGSIPANSTLIFQVELVGIK